VRNDDERLATGSRTGSLKRLRRHIEAGIGPLLARVKQLDEKRDVPVTDLLVLRNGLLASATQYGVAVVAVAG
jgi:hypothetical protein